MGKERKEVITHCLSNEYVKALRFYIDTFCVNMNEVFFRQYKNSFFTLEFSYELKVVDISMPQIECIIFYEIKSSIYQSERIFLKRVLLIEEKYDYLDIEGMLKSYSITIITELFNICAFGLGRYNLDCIMSGNAILEDSPDHEYCGKTLRDLFHEQIDKELKKK